MGIFSPNFNFWATNQGTPAPNFAFLGQKIWDLGRNGAESQTWEIWPWNEAVLSKIVKFTPRLGLSNTKLRILILITWLQILWSKILIFGTKVSLFIPNLAFSAPKLEVFNPQLEFSAWNFYYQPPKLDVSAQNYKFQSKIHNPHPKLTVLTRNWEI